MYLLKKGILMNSPGYRNVYEMYNDFDFPLQMEEKVNLSFLRIYVLFFITFMFKIYVYFITFMFKIYIFR